MLQSLHYIFIRQIQWNVSVDAARMYLVTLYLEMTSLLKIYSKNYYLENTLPCILYKNEYLYSIGNVTVTFFVNIPNWNKFNTG